jgi:hypothetical protein
MPAADPSLISSSSPSSSSPSSLSSLQYRRDCSDTRLCKLAMLIISGSRSGGSFEYWYPTPLYPLSQAAMRDSNLFLLNLDLLGSFFPEQ